MSRTYELPLTLTWGGDIQTGEADVVVHYGIDWAQRPCGFSDEMVVDVEIVSVYGTPWADYHDWGGLGLTKAEALDELIQTVMWDHTDEMVEHASEVEVEAEERAEEALYEERW